MVVGKNQTFEGGKKKKKKRPDDIKTLVGSAIPIFGPK